MEHINSGKGLNREITNTDKNYDGFTQYEKKY